MDFSLTESERDLVGLCREFAQKEIAVRAPLAWEEARCPTDLLREMGTLGLLGMLIPEQWGGIGMSTVGFVAAMEQIGVADQSVAAAWQAHVTIGSLPLYLFGNDAQRERWLRPLAEGRALGAFGLTEPDAGSDARGIRTQAVAPRRRLVDQRAQDVHLQRGHRHVVRRHAARAHGVERRARRRVSRRWSSRRTPPDSPWVRRCAGSVGAVSTRASCTSTTCGLPTTTSSAIPPMGLSQFLNTLEVGRISIAALVAQPDPGRARPGDRLREAATTVRSAHLQVPGDPVQARRHRDRARGRALAHLSRRVIARRRATVPQGSIDGEAQSEPPGGVGRVGSRTDSRRNGVHARLPGRPLLLRREGARDRRRHQRDPAPRDRARRASGRRTLRPRARRRIASAMSSRSGSHARSRSGAYGGGVDAAPMRWIGASRSQKPSRATVAAISAPIPNGTTASCAIRSRLVLCTDSRIGPMSSGATVRRSMTSTEIPSPSSVSAAASASCTMRETDTTVMSEPARTTADVPIGRM